ncbi:hypothetical protein IQ254_27580 [Nodosilinea sp. LEGE 07088]|uniref:PIN domain-containing protein n=1 Tax=Nodosilinea sp. LEGE 07088 TaxID=2777968 RepID=UPI001881831C|nr:PIN domain-containing protein [Nodosilinea sp. LEGE 07088]MBE9140916.1 hypothetical protein [Nodosilinea sp. LEGE 07088]
MRTVLVDTNLLVLLIVGATSRDYIARHKRLTAFIPQDYDVLLHIISDAAVRVTPNILTEISNLAAYIDNLAKRQIFETFQKLISNCLEVYVPSTTAIRRWEFIHLGLTDAAVLEALTNQVVLLTTDLDLFLAAQSAGVSAINFNQLRDRYL